MNTKHGIACRSMVGAGALSLTHFGSPCPWHPQGPSHPSTQPRATTSRLAHHPARASTAPRLVVGCSFEM
jgi:hypothetical protein